MIQNQKRKKSGQAMVEFIIILPVMILLVLGILQFSFIYKAKITLNYAAFEAARAGTVNNARQFAMQNAMARSLAPLYTHDDTVAEFKAARELVRQQINNGFLRIDLINPSPDSFNDFGRTNSGVRSIANDNLIYRGTTVGTDSLQTIQDANLLKIQTYYCYEMIVPFVNRIIWLMMRYSTGASPTGQPDLGRQARFGSPVAGSFNESCVTQQYDNSSTTDRFYGIPIRSQAVMRMHTDAILEP
jgi:Flp pilus assembly protein TadG